MTPVFDRATGLWTLGDVIACVGVGVVAIVLSTRPLERVATPPVQVYPAEG